MTRFDRAILFLNVLRGKAASDIHTAEKGQKDNDEEEHGEVLLLSSPLCQNYWPRR